MSGSSEYFRKPLGLALSGGGALGCWEAAALHAFERARGPAFDSVLGFSAGALAAAAYAQDRSETALSRWKRIDGHILRFSPRLWPLSLCSDRPVWEQVDYALDDSAAQKRTRCRLAVISTRLRRDRRVYALFHPEGPWDAPLSRHLAASCSVPLIFPPVEVEFQGSRERLFDGGVPCAEPLSFHPLSPCRDVIVIEVVRPDERSRVRHGIAARLDQKGRQTLITLMGQGIASLKSIPEPPRIFRLFPSQVLDFGMLDFNGSNISRAISLGARDAHDFMSNPSRYLA